MKLQNISKKELLRPVSYTHLDVYKRQTYTSLNKISGSEIVNYNLREDNHWQPDFDELETVSYTHLDVYKRQPLSFRCASP